ncbi:MAG: hypothetical protein O7G30_05700 [Proteobacteria bacterium]|nr:hypothetical protein [Pseudomonadota bacterium]
MSASPNAGPAEELAARIHESTPKPIEITRFLDGLTHGERVAAVRGCGRKEQSRLWEVVDAYAPVRLTDLVPPATGDLQTVRHFGRNTLPAFTHFEKRFTRPKGESAEHPGELYGFNFQSLSSLTGPGYFVAEDSPEREEVLIDYRRVPTDHPQGWPEIRSNERGVGRLVYGFMVDTLRRVSEHVTVGSAARRGVDLGSWFLLCREP